MIYDKVKNGLRYKGISDNLDKALEFMVNTDLASLPLGKCEIDGDKVFFTVMDAQAVEEVNDGLYEYHKKYMDIQIDIIGTEMIQMGFDPAEEITPYTHDIGIKKCSLASSCIMGPGRFILFEAEEFHKPNLAAAENKKFKKVVFKVAVE